MIFHPEDSMSNKILKRSTDDMRTIFNQCKKRDINPEVIFDIGANVGVYSIHLANHFSESKVYSFEPVLSSFEYLLKNINDNKISNIIPYNFGFHKEEIMMNLGYPLRDIDDPRRSETYTYSDREEVAGLVKCEFKMLDDFVYSNKIEKIDILKVDAEGAESDIFKCGENALKITKMLHIELWPENDYLVDFLKNNGFKFVRQRHRNFLFVNGGKND